MKVNVGRVLPVMALLLLPACSNTLGERDMVERTKMTALYEPGFDESAREIVWLLLQQQEVSSEMALEKLGEPDYEFSPSKPTDLQKALMDSWYVDHEALRGVKPGDMNVLFWHPALRAHNDDWAQWEKQKISVLNQAYTVPAPGLTLLVGGGRVWDFARGKLQAPVDMMAVNLQVDSGQEAGLWMEASRLDPAKGKFRLDIGGRARQRIAARRAELELDMRSTAKPDWRHQAALRLPDEWLNIEADDKVASRLYVEMDPELLNGLKGSWLVVAGRVKLYLNEQGDRLATDEPLVVTPEAMEIR